MSAVSPGTDDQSRQSSDHAESTASPMQSGASLESGGREVVKLDTSHSPVDTVPRKSDLFDLTAPFRNRFMANVLSIWKSCSLGDPDMWYWWKSCLGNCIDTIWVDFEHEVERRIMNSLSVIPPEDTSVVEGPTPNGSSVRQYWLRIRAFILHHYLAHNLSVFGKLKDPVYLFMLLITTIPVNGLRVFFFLLLLVMLRFPGPPDEFQLVNYILVFKGTQCVTSGFAGMASGALRYFMCYTCFRDELLDCVEKHGPGSGMSSGQIFNYLGSVVLVWVAFSMLPISTKQAAVDKSTSKVPAPKETWEKLRWLLYYDMACFTLSSLVLSILSVLTCVLYYWKNGALEGVTREQQFHVNLFWCNVFYSLLSLPFFLMKWVPGALAVLTHTTITGYNAHGACVAFRFRSSTEPSEVSAPGRPPPWTEGATAQRITRLLRLAERGRVARGESYNGELNLFGDLAAGVFPGIAGFLTKRRLCREAGRQAQDVNGARRSADVPREGLESACSGPVRRRFGSRRMSPEPPPADDIGQVAKQTQEQDGQPQEMDGLPQSSSSFELLLPGKNHAVIASIQIPPNAIEQNSEGRTLFGVEVAPAYGEPWFVKRRYGEFRALSFQLGKQSYKNAPFPPKLVSACTGVKLESRRKSLETWLWAVVRDAARLEDDARIKLISFLSPGCSSPADQATGPEATASTTVEVGDMPAHGARAIDDAM